MQGIDFSYSKKILEQVQQDPSSPYAIGQLTEVLYVTLQAIERLQKELSKREAA
jgi:hypothetical protein